MSEETGAMSEKALHTLRAAVADAGDEPGVYVSRARVMEQTGVSDLEEFEPSRQDAWTESQRLAYLYISETGFPPMMFSETQGT
jgi:hypothetical protein